MSLLMPCFFVLAAYARLIQLNRCSFHSCRSHGRTHPHTDPTGVVHTFAPFGSDVFLGETLALNQKYNDMQIKWCALAHVCVHQSVHVPQWAMCL